MDLDFRYKTYKCSIETWRLLWLATIMFAVIVTFQYFELPYGNVFSSLSSSRKELETGSNGFNSTGLYGANKTSGEEDEADRDAEFVLRGNLGMNGSSEIDNDEDQASFEQFTANNTDSAKDRVNISGHNNSAPDADTIKSLPTGNATLASQNGSTSLHDPVLHVPALPPVDSSPNVTVEKNDPMLHALALPPVDSLPNKTIEKNMESIIGTPVTPINTSIPSASESAASSSQNNNATVAGKQETDVPVLHDDRPLTPVPGTKKVPKKPISAVTTLSEMNDLLLQSWSTPNSQRARWPAAVDQQLLDAKAQIQNAPKLENDPTLYAPIYGNVSMFKRSYELMENMLKVYVYKEGKRPILHSPVLRGIYASEGWFMKLMESNKQFTTKDPRKAHLFYLPFGSRNLEEALYVKDSHSHKNLIQYLKNYIDLISAKHPFWNRTEGADHFLVACHDWAPSETKVHMVNCIRALCNADVKEGYTFGKDVSLPETYVRNPQKPLRDLGGKPPSKRSILAFFAGSMHGYLRPILLQHWENRDPDMKIFGKLPNVKGQRNYIQYMKSSKYCICAKGFEVNSPRVVEAIFYECVPVIISDNFVPPFFEVLNWESFAVFVMEKDIPNLKNILLSIPRKTYLRMQMRVKKVQQHFLWHTKPVKYDLFHMILHSVWYNRVFQSWPN